MNYYNDNDPKSAAWLRELIKQNLIPPGYVDERSITDVTGSDLTAFIQCHFFAGIGGWAEALRLAGVAPDVPLWTGSCPCQPFSCAGQRRGEKDERHLWPEFWRLIAERHPPIVFGEQVASADGRLWLAGVRTDLENLGYAVGAADLCAVGVGAPHIRQRLYWVADSQGERWNRGAGMQGENRRRFAETGGEFGGVAITSSQRFQRRGDRGQGIQTGSGRLLSAGSGQFGFWSKFIWIPCADGKARRIEPTIFPLVDGVPGRVGLLRGSGNAIVPEVAAEFIGAYMEIERRPL